MTDSVDTPKKVGKSMTLFGILCIILGLLAMLAPGLTGLSIAVMIGVFVVIGGIIRMIWAFQSGGFGKGLLAFALGLLTLMCGVVLVSSPFMAAGFLSVLLVIYFIADGVSEIAAGLKLKPVQGWGLMAFSGVISILLGVMIFAQYPLSGPVAMGVLLGIKLFFIGLLMLTAESAS